MVAVPAPTAVTTPVVGCMVTTVGGVAVHVPPAVALLRVVVPPTQSVCTPVMGDTLTTITRLQPTDGPDGRPISRKSDTSCGPVVVNVHGKRPLKYCRKVGGVKSSGRNLLTVPALKLGNR